MCISSRLSWSRNYAKGEDSRVAIINLSYSLMDSLRENGKQTKNYTYNEVSRDVFLLARMMAVKLYYSQIEVFMFELSMWRCGDDLLLRADELHRSLERC